MKLSTRLIRNALANYLGAFVGLVSALLLTPFMLHRLGDEQYGMWTLFLSILGWFYRLDFGLANGAAKYIAEYSVLGEHKRVNQVINTLWPLFTLGGILIVAGSFCLSPRLPQLLRLPERYSAQGTLTFLILAIDFGVNFSSAVLNAALVGRQRIDLLSLVGVIGVVLKVMLVVAVLSLGLGLPTLALATLSISVTVAALRFYFLRRTYQQLRVSLTLFDRMAVAKLATYGLFYFLLFVGASMELPNNLVINYSASVALIAPFSVAMRIANLVHYASGSVGTVLMPAFSEVDALGRTDQMQQMLIQGTRFVLAASAMLVIPLGFLAGPLISLWVGAEYTWIAGVTVVLLLTMLLRTGFHPASTLLLGLARHRLQAAVSLLTGALNLLVAILLVQSIGLMGVALGNLITLGLMSFLLVNLCACRVIRLSFWRLAQRTIVPLFLPAFASGLLGWAFLRYRYPDTMWMLGIEATGCALLFGLVYFWGLSRRERVLLVGEVRGLMRGHGGELAAS